MPFIVLEGPDGSGTTKHAGLLAEKLRSEGKEVLLTAEPTDGDIGKVVRTLLEADQLPSPEALQLLFCADRAAHVQDVIAPALERGEIVISDRYSLSTIIYGSALDLNRQWLEGINAAFPQPDITIITLPPLEVCKERLSRRSYSDNLEGDALQEEVYGLYAAETGHGIVHIDTSGELEESAELIRKATEVVVA